MKRLLILTMIPAIILGCESVDSDRMVELKDLTLTTPEGWEVYYQARNNAQIMIPTTTDLDYLDLNIRESDTPSTSDEISVSPMSCEENYQCFKLEMNEKSYEVYFTTSLTKTTPDQLGLSDEDLIEFLMTAEPSKD